MSKELKMQFQNKCIGLTDDHRDYIYGTDWKGYAKALEKQVDAYNKLVRGLLMLRPNRKIRIEINTFLLDLLND